MCAITGMPAETSVSTCAATRRPPSSLTACAPPSFMNRDARLQRLLRRCLVRTERQVGDDECTLGAAHDAAHERQQLVDGDRNGGVVAVDDVRRRVADEQDRDAGLVEHPRCRVVVGRQHRPALAAILRDLQVADRDPPVLNAAVQRGLGHGLASLLSSRPARRSPGTSCGHHYGAPIGSRLSLLTERETTAQSPGRRSQACRSSGARHRLVIGSRRSRPKALKLIFGPGGYWRRFHSAPSTSGGDRGRRARGRSRRRRSRRRRRHAST